MVVAPRITNDKVVPQCWHTRRRIFQARTIIIRRYCTDVKFIEYVFPTPNSNREQARVEAFLAFLASVGLKVGIPRRSRRKNEFSKDRPKATSLGNLQVKFSLCDYFVCEVVFALALDSYPTGWLLPKTKNVNSVLRATKPSVLLRSGVVKHLSPKMVAYGLEVLPITWWRELFRGILHLASAQ